MFCLAFSRLLSQLRNAFKAAGLNVVLPHLPGGIFAGRGPAAAVAGEVVELLPPTYMNWGFAVKALVAACRSGGAVEACRPGPWF